MSNILEVPQQQAIQALIGKGWSARRIDRAGHQPPHGEALRGAAPKCTEVITGSAPPDESKCTTQVITGSRSLCVNAQRMGTMRSAT